jgi:hypothetical protein
MVSKKEWPSKERKQAWNRFIRKCGNGYATFWPKKVKIVEDNNASLWFSSFCTTREEWIYFVVSDNIYYQHGGLLQGLTSCWSQHVFRTVMFPNQNFVCISCLAHACWQKGRGKLRNACKIVARKPTHKYLLLYIYFKYPINWNLIWRVRYRKFVVLFVKTPHWMPEYMFCVSYLDLWMGHSVPTLLYSVLI